jgi:hypothetical protein
LGGTVVGRWKPLGADLTVTKTVTAKTGGTTLSPTLAERLAGHQFQGRILGPPPLERIHLARTISRFARRRSSETAL